MMRCNWKCDRTISSQQSAVSHWLLKYTFSFRLTCFLFLSLTIFVLIACSPKPPNNDSGLQAVTAVPTLDVNDPDSLCEAAAQQWGRDWPTTIRALEAL